MAEPLADIRVVDASTGRAGRIAAMFFADFGAEVVRVVADERTPADVVFNRGKTIAPDADVDALVRGADVLITEELRSVNPSTVVLCTGRSSEAFLAAEYGVSLRQASFDGGPIDSIIPVLTTIQGVWGAACAVAALLERERSGEGQVVTVAGEHGVMVAAAGGLTFTREALAQRPTRAGGPGGSIPFYRTYQCKDGEWLFFAALTPRFTQIGFEVLGITSLFDDPRLEGRGRAAMIAPQHIPWVIDAVAERFMSADRDEWLKRLRDAGCPVGAVLDRDAWMDHPQVEAIGIRMELEDAVTLGVPLVMEKTPGAARPRTHAASPQWTPRETRATRASPPPGPLHGVRVLDLGAIIAGPFSASLLCELGADVIKVEPLSGDSFRGPGFAAYNKGQRGIALDLRHPDGKKTFGDLVRTTDVVIDNYRPGVLQRLGITWEDLAKINPRIISLSITGFGDGGPFGGDAGFDPVLQAMSGMMKAQGGDSPPVFYTVPVNDVAGSATLAFGAALALFVRQRTGIAQKASTSLAAMSVLLQAEALIRYDGRPPPPVGSRDHLGPHALDRYYRCSDGWVRVQGDREPNGIETMTREEAIQAMSGAVAARTTAELADDETLLQRQILHRDPRPDRDGFTAGRHAIFERTMRDDVLVSPALGQHTREVLAEIGYTDERIDALVASEAVLEARSSPRP